MNSIDMMPLVSVYVVTYNSSEFIIETLDSIKSQTYQELELIVSDDCSTDDTVKICREWLSANSSRFKRTVLLESNVNTGVSANCNRAERECHGSWVKCLAGDDLLVPECIECLVDHVQTDGDAIYVFSKVEAFGADEARNNYVSNVLFDYDLISRPTKEQLDSLLLFNRNYIPAATFFFNRAKSIELGITNDERIPMIEDYPKWINILRKGVAFSFVDKPLVQYRIHPGSLSTTKVRPLRFRQSGALLFMYYLFIPQFKAKPSFMLLKKLVFAHHFTGVTNPFWKLLMNIYAFARRIKGLNPYPPMF